MKRYTYRDTKKNETLFTTDESDDCSILEADIKFEAATGIDPFKAMWVGCIIDKIENEEEEYDIRDHYYWIGCL